MNIVFLLHAAAGWSPAWLPTRLPASRPVCRSSLITAAERLVYCDSLSKSYDGKRYQFRDISLGIASGQRVGLIGVNGVGKSTLMKCLAGLEDPDGGSVGCEGQPVILYVEQEPARGQDSRLRGR